MPRRPVLSDPPDYNGQPRELILRSSQRDEKLPLGESRALQFRLEVYL
jgi:hypothetical protein